MNKRAILVTRDRTIIMGELDPAQHEIKDYIEVQYQDRTIPASLVMVKPRMVIYREIIQPESGRFNEFNPKQL